jgi:hypothetical protein
MNDRQRLKYDSYLAVRTHCARDTSIALTSSIPAWTTLYDRFLAKISYADACVLIQNSDLTGITQHKNQTRAELTAHILQVSGALCTLALLREDTVLEAKADIVPSDIYDLPDALVDDKATEFLELARSLPATDLTQVGLTEGKLDNFETHIETYNLLLGTPRAARGTKTAATANLAQTLEEIERLLDKGLDKLALQFTGTTFHQEYLLARDPIAPAKTQPTAPTAAPTA